MHIQEQAPPFTLELHEYERQFTSLLQNTKLFSFMLDTNSNILFTNNHFMERTGWKWDDLIGRNWTTLLLPEEYREKAGNLNILVQNGLLEFTNYFENEIFCKNGDRIRVGWNCVPLKDPKGAIVGTTQVGEIVTSSIPSSPIVRRHSLVEERPSSPKIDSLLRGISVSSNSEMVGDYVIIKPLGKNTGKETHVKLAVHRYTEEKVAIKFLPKKSMNEQELQRANREIKILESLNALQNPHIVKLIESMETDSHLILIQEYVSGGELISFMDKNHRLSEAKALRLFRQILSALECCHENNIIHRDIKMQNILLDGNCNIKLIDFGVSNFMEEGVFRNTFCGTPAYSPPEILLGEQYHGPEVDLWCIGVVLYYMLTAKFPFPNIGAILKGKFREPENITLACLDLLKRMLTVKKEDRITLEEVLNHPWVNSEHSDDQLDKLLEPENKRRKTEN